jgi:riboflavin synthase
MFTGIIEEMGAVKKISRKGENILLQITAAKVLQSMAIGKSISVNGVCLTVLEFNNAGFTAEATKETLNKSALADLRVNDFVNLERPLLATGRFDGHFVMGHIDGVGIIKKIDKSKDAVLLTIEMDADLSRYVVDKGSIAVDGISLTVVSIEKSIFTVNIIPHTCGNTNIKNKKTGDKVNIETDVFGKYVEKVSGLKSKVTKEFLKEKGFN